MTVHELKTINPHFKAVWEKKKKMEVRNNDRNFSDGDVLHLREYDSEKSQYTGREMLADVTHFLSGGDFGIDINHCVMSIKVFRNIDKSDLPF